MVVAYHRDYRGDQTVYSESVDPMGEVHTIRRPGVISVHCTCSLGVWTRNQVKDDERRRIPTLSDVINGRIPYVFERPDLDDQAGLSDDAKRFLARWRQNFGKPLPRVVRVEPEEVANQLRARAAREGGAA